MARFATRHLILAVLAVLGVVAAAGAFGPGPEAASPASSALRLNSPAQTSRDLLQNAKRRHEFYFTRAIYSSGWGRRGNSWDTDWPKADHQFLTVLGRLARELDSYDSDNPVRLDDPELRRFPFVYAVEVGRMDLTEAEVKGLRGYLLAGGFLIVDDFWGTYQWQAFEQNIMRVLPEYQIVDLPITHELFRTYYEIEEILQVPNYRNGCAGGPYHEQDGYVPAVRAIFNEKGRLLVLISWNSDLGDAWEWMELSCYPLQLSTFAYQLAVNTIVYSMAH